jgi:hypothetical protein
MKRKIFFSIVAVLFAVLLVIIGAVIGMSLQTSTTPATITPSNDNEGVAVGEPNPNTPTDETGDELTDPNPADTMSDFASTRYNIQFSYPKEFGTHKVTVNTGYFFNEEVSFTNSDIKATYVRIEGSMGTTSDGSVTTKQGYTGSYDIAQGGPDSNYTLSVFITSPGENGTRLFLSSKSSTQAGAEAELAKIQKILDTLEFDFSNVPLGGCETACR